MGKWAAGGLAQLHAGAALLAQRRRLSRFLVLIGALQCAFERSDHFSIAACWSGRISRGVLYSEDTQAPRFARLDRRCRFHGHIRAEKRDGTLLVLQVAGLTGW